MTHPSSRVLTSTLAACAAAACLFLPARARAQPSLDRADADVLLSLKEFRAPWLDESETQAFANRTSPLQIRFGARVRSSHVALGAGIGPSLSEAPGVAQPSLFSLALTEPEAETATKAAAPTATDDDGDGDGVPDSQDACPREPGVKSSDRKTSGCAAQVDAGRIKDKAEVTFSGYQSLPGNRGVVFVELTDAVAVEVSRSGQVIEYKLLGATVPLKNNKNPLLLRDFSSSAISARLVADKPARRAKQRGKQLPSVRLVITLRGNVSPSHRMIPRGKGAVLEVQLPPLPTR